EQAMALLQRLQGDDTRKPAYWQTILQVEQAKRNTVAAEIARGYALFYAGDPWGAESVWKGALTKATGEDAREVIAALHNSAYLRQEPEAALHYATEGVRRWPND